MKPFSQGHTKVFNYLLTVERTRGFQERIKELRIKHSIPLSGYEYKKVKHRDRDILALPPNDWHRCIENTSKNPKEVDLRFEELERDVTALASEYGFFDDAWPDPLEIYLFYNVIEELGYDLMSYNLCLIRDIPQEKKMRLDPRHESMQSFYKKRDEIEDALYPIAIRISPNASLRDILDYIRRSYYLIKRDQDRYSNKAIKIGTVKNKKKSVQERNDFIYQNRQLPRKELMKLGMQKFNDFPDHGAVAKIISLEKKKRE